MFITHTHTHTLCVYTIACVHDYGTNRKSLMCIRNYRRVIVPRAYGVKT